MCDTNTQLMKEEGTWSFKEKCGIVFIFLLGLHCAN